jgi:hypothetical protein
MSISHPLDAALYARCCSPHQNQPGSIASQIDALRQRAAADGHVVAEQMCFIDEDCSGATLLRRFSSPLYLLSRSSVKEPPSLSPAA